MSQLSLRIDGELAKLILRDPPPVDPAILCGVGGGDCRDRPERCPGGAAVRRGTGLGSPMPGALIRCNAT